MREPSDAGARREMERMIWAAAFVKNIAERWGGLATEEEMTENAASWADRVAAAYREHGPTR